MALRLKRQGIARVRPLHGGLTRWMDCKFPVAELKPVVAGTVPDGLSAPKNVVPDAVVDRD